jgi:hypothetical protein
MLTLYKPFLYLNEEEFKFFGVYLPDDFWECDNIYLEYKSLFIDKLHHSADKMLENYLRAEIDYEIYKIITDFHDKEHMNELLQEIIQPVVTIFNKSFKNIILSNFNEATDIYNWTDGKVHSVIDFLDETEIIFGLISNFTDRLKVLQNKGNIFAYYDELFNGEDNVIVSDTSNKDYNEMIASFFDVKFTTFEFFRFVEDIAFDDLMDLCNYLEN